MATAVKEMQLGLPGFAKKAGTTDSEIRQFPKGRPVSLSIGEVRIAQEGGLKAERVKSKYLGKENFKKGKPAIFKALNDAEAFRTVNGESNPIQAGDIFTAFPGEGRKVKIGY